MCIDYCTPQVHPVDVIQTLVPADGSIRILTFAQSLQGGGVERVMLRLVRGWVDAGQRVTMVLGDASGPLTAEIPGGVEVIDLQTNHMGMMVALPGYVRRITPDIVFCPGNHYTGAAAWLKLRLGRDCPPIVAKVSNRLDRDDQHFPVAQGYRLWLRAHPGFVDHIVAMSPAMAREAVRMTGIGANRASVIANPPSHQPTGIATEPMSGGDYLIGIGRLSQQKRWDRAIAALAGVARRDTRLMILGEGESRGTLEHQVGALGLRERVRLPGYSTNPRPALEQARALVLTSDFEGVPGVIHEALALGTPVVTTESSVAIREIVSSPHQGSIVPTHDSRALIAALDHWLVPGRPRPDPIPERGGDSIERYVRLFEELLLDRRLSRS